MKQPLYGLLISVAVLLGACTNSTNTHPVLTSNDLIGLPVETQSGELIGTLRGLLLAPADGRIEYGVVRLAPGPLEFGKMPLHEAPGRVLVPWRLLAIAPSGAHLVADSSLDRVRNAPLAPDQLQTDRPGWDTVYTTYWCDDDSCADASGGSQASTANGQ